MNMGIKTINLKQPHGFYALAFTFDPNIKWVGGKCLYGVLGQWEMFVWCGGKKKREKNNQKKQKRKLTITKFYYTRMDFRLGRDNLEF